MSETIEDDKLYYIEDTSRLHGNTKYWWVKNNYGYTPDTKEARAWTGEEIKKEISRSDSDLKAWPVEYIDKHISHSVLCENVEWDKGIIVNVKPNET